MIYNEARLLSIKVNTHTHWYKQQLYPTKCPTLRPIEAPRYFEYMTPEQLSSVQHLHIFTRRSRLGAKNPGIYISHGIFRELYSMRTLDVGISCPRTLTITLRQLDWYYQGCPDFNLDNMISNKHLENVFRSLKVLRMELETPAAQKRNLDPVVQSLLGFEPDIGNSQILVPHKQVNQTSWIGHVTRPYPHEDDDISEHYVVTVTWRADFAREKNLA